MATDALNVVYTGSTLTYINVSAGQNLQTILSNINTAVNSMNPAPNYSGYNLSYYGYSITQTDGTTHPTNTQNFAEGISKIVCKTEHDLYTFTGTTYPANQTILSSAISALQTPGLTYSHSNGGVSIAITAGMTRNEVLTTTYTAVGNITDKLNPSGANWGTLSVSSPTTLNAAFNTLITYVSGLSTTLAGKQNTLPTFNNTSNCLSGGATDSISTTVSSLITYTCSLSSKVVNASSITSTCVTTNSNATTLIQNIVDKIDSIAPYVITSVDDNFTLTQDACNGTSLAINTSAVNYGAVKVSTDDTGVSFISDKIVAGSKISITTLSPGGDEHLEISVSDPDAGKLKVNALDSTLGYLQQKISPVSVSDWGIGGLFYPSADNSKLNFTMTISEPDMFVGNLLNYINSSETFKAQFCSMVSSCTTGVTCNTVTDLAVVKSSSDFAASWTAPGDATALTIQYRQRGNSEWISNVNISPANPLSASATSATINLSGCPNTVYQFVIVTSCTGGSTYGATTEAIIYSCQTLSANVTAGVITVTQNALITVETIQYTLYQSTTPLETVTATGSNPVASFSAVSAGTYTVKWRYGTTVNGVTLYSNDSSQLNAYCTSGSIVVS